MTDAEREFYKRAGNEAGPSVSFSAQRIPYDPTLLYEYAERLYSNAMLLLVLIVILFTGVGGVLGLFGGLIGVAIGVCIGAIIGILVGREVAFWIKLKAQLVLCQAEIERNTRNRPAPVAVAETPVMRVSAPSDGMKTFGASS